MHEQLIAPHGGALIDLLVPPERAALLRAASRDWPSWQLTTRQICDLELLLTGAFSPLQGFMCRQDYESVCATMRLADGTLWPMPVTLDIPDRLARELQPGQHLALRDVEGTMLAALQVEELWQGNWLDEAAAVYGTAQSAHPGVSYLCERTHPWYVGGRLEGIQLPPHYDFRALRHTPASLRAELAHKGWSRVVAFQTRNPLHRAHVELTLRAARAADAHVLIHPCVGLTTPGDVDHYTRVRCYQTVAARYPAGMAQLSLLPLAMRMAGPREALWHAIIRKNYGCSHFIVGRDHAGPGRRDGGEPFYGPYEAQELVKRFESELGVNMVPFKEMVFLRNRGAYVPIDEAAATDEVLSLSGTELRRRLQSGFELPDWFTFPEVADELRRTHRPRHLQGFTVFFTGLSGAGKSTIANVLLVKLLEHGGRPVTLLDGDLVRTHLSSELGFSKEHRDLNVRRISFVAAEITKNGGVAICAPIAPYDRVRKEARAMVGTQGGFVLVHVATSLEVCEQRDSKGLYAKARAGAIAEFTGVSDPYEAPSDAELVIDTAGVSAESAAQIILAYLQDHGYLPCAVELPPLATRAPDASAYVGLRESSPASDHPAGDSTLMVAAP